MKYKTKIRQKAPVLFFGRTFGQYFLVDNANSLKLFTGKLFSVFSGCEGAAKFLFPISGTGANDPTTVSTRLCCCRCYTFYLQEINAISSTYSGYVGDHVPGQCMNNPTCGMTHLIS